MKDDQRFRHIFLMLDSDQAGERENALGRLHALRSKTDWPSFRSILESFEGKIPDASEAQRKLRAENAELRAQNARLRDKITQTRDLFELREAAMSRPSGMRPRWLTAGALATVFFIAMGYQLEPVKLTREAGVAVASGVTSILASIQ